MNNFSKFSRPLPRRLISVQILNCIHNQPGPYRNQQDICRHAYVTMSCRRRSELHNNRRRQIIEDNVPGQRPTPMPHSGLTTGHAAVVLLGQARRAVAGTVLLLIIVTDDIPVLVDEIDAFVYIIPVLVVRIPIFTALITIASLFLLVFLALIPAAAPLFLLVFLALVSAAGP